jgi:CheY-like chemotaxis protein
MNASTDILLVETDILLVEDDPNDVRLAMAVFRSLHMSQRCVVASDGEDAMEFLHSRGRFCGRAPGLPRLIVLDLKMPRMDGFELLQHIKTDDGLKDIPVVALTSSREERDVERAYDLNVNGYVVKSIDFADYRTTLQALARYWADVNQRPPGFVHRRSSVSATSTVPVERRKAFLGFNGWLWPLQPC